MGQYLLVRVHGRKASGAGLTAFGRGGLDFFLGAVGEVAGVGVVGHCVEWGVGWIGLDWNGFWLGWVWLGWVR